MKANIGKRTLASGRRVETGRSPPVRREHQDQQLAGQGRGARAPGADLALRLNAKRLLVLWQEKCVSRLKVRNTRVQTYKTIRTWAATELNMNQAATDAALSALFDDGIIRMGSYETSDRGKKHTVRPSTDLTLRDEYVPSSPNKLDTATASAAAFSDMTMGVATTTTWSS